MLRVVPAFASVQFILSPTAGSGKIARLQHLVSELVESVDASLRRLA